MSTLQKTKGQGTPEVAQEVEFGIVPPNEAIQSLEIYGNDPLELKLPKDLPKVDFLSYGKRLGQAMEFGAWRVGDYANAGIAVYGLTYEEMALETGLVEGFLRNCASVAGRTPTQYRVMGMEKMRLMLGRKGDRETLPKLIKRLGGKSQTELRKMAASGSSRTNESEGETEQVVTATDLYASVKETIDLLERFDIKNKLQLLAGLENDKDDGNAIKQLARFINALSDQLNAEAPPKAE